MNEGQPTSVGDSDSDSSISSSSPSSSPSPNLSPRPSRIISKMKMREQRLMGAALQWALGVDSAH